jgi:hypothetical protein
VFRNKTTEIAGEMDDAHLAAIIIAANFAARATEVCLKWPSRQEVSRVLRFFIY